MSKLHVLSATRHAGWRWQPRTGAGFAAQRGLSPVVIAELGQAVAHFPLVFQRSDDTRLGFAALFSLKPAYNAFVNAQGRWLVPYMPTFLRHHPFQLAQTAEQGYVVMLDEASPAVDPTGAQGEVILDSNGHPSETVSQIAAFLKRYAAQQHITDKACRALDKYHLLAPLRDLRPDSPSADSSAPGLYRISQAALEALPAEIFASLRDVGALSLAYAQLLSMPRLYALQKAHSEQANVERIDNLDELFAEGDGDISFNWDAININS